MTALPYCVVDPFTISIELILLRTSCSTHSELNQMYDVNNFKIMLMFNLVIQVVFMKQKEI